LAFPISWLPENPLELAQKLRVAPAALHLIWQLKSFHSAATFS